MFDVSGMNIDLKDRSRWVAIIGSRNASQKELDATYRLAYKLAKRGDIIVSGLAIGADTFAHRGAIDAGGTTIAIVNTQKGKPVYPDKNKALAEDIQRHGCIIHPYKTPARSSNEKFNQFQKRLVERDLVVAYLCPVICAVKDTDEIFTGGTKWAVKYGIEYGKKVFRFDGDLKFHENPKVEDCRLWWIPEINVSNITF